MSLIDLDLPTPAELRDGWAALAAVLASRGWRDLAYAEPDQWLYHDGGGNWACLRLVESHGFLLVGHDHEYSDTYYGEAAKYFQEEETDLLQGAPEWWGSRLDPRPYGEWIGFVYGWNGTRWQRASYDLPDGFDQVGLLRACSVGSTELLQQHAMDAPGLANKPPSAESLNALVSAGAHMTAEMLENVVPGWDIPAGVAAARRFLAMPAHAAGG